MIEIHVQFFPTRRGEVDSADHDDVPVLGVVDGRLLVLPSYSPRCIARNRAGGGRCARRVTDLWRSDIDERWTPITMGGRRYYIAPLRSRGEHTDRRALEQRCYRHGEADNSDFCDPEHHPFDPALDTGFLLPSISVSPGRDLAAIDRALSAAGAAFDRCVTRQAGVEATVELVAEALREALRAGLGGAA